MSPLLAGIIGIVLLLVLLFSGMPIAITMAFVGFLGFAYLTNFTSALGQVMPLAFTTFSDYNQSVIPLFILMGSFCFYARISTDLYDTAHIWLGQLRGGLAIATVGACAGFSAICGSSVATAAAMGTAALPEMKRFKYSDALATGCVAAGGTMGSLIPPSMAFALYGIITQNSIGKLFLAGIIPGILQATFYIGIIYFVCLRNPKMGPPGPVTSFAEKLASLKNTWIVLALFLLVMGGLYFGVFTPTEGAGIGAFGAFVFGVARRRLGWKTFKDSLVETAETTGMLLIILFGAMLFNYFMAVSRLPLQLATIMNDLSLNRYIIIVIIMLIYLVLGCIMDPIGMVLLTIPIFYPLILSMGFDPIWFGVLVVRMCEIGCITPPVGINVFVIQGVAKDVPMYTIFRGILPFIIADFIHVGLLIAIPSISMFLPTSMK